MASAPGGFALLVPGLPFTFQVAFSRSLTRLSFLTSKVGIISRSPSWLSKDVKALSKSVASRAIHSFQKHLHKIYGKLSPRNEAGREWKFEILHWREGGIVCRKGRIVNIRGLVGFRRDSSMRPKAAKTTVQGWRWLCPHSAFMGTGQAATGQSSPNCYNHQGLSSRPSPVTDTLKLRTYRNVGQDPEINDHHRLPLAFGFRDLPSRPAHPDRDLKSEYQKASLPRVAGPGVFIVHAEGHECESLAWLAESRLREETGKTG